MMKLYYAEVLNPRKTCAAARYLNSSVEFVFVDVFSGASRTPDFLALNPNGQVPVLQDGPRILTESNAIMCYLSDRAGADFWPHDERQIEVLRWLFWDAMHFSRSASELYFEFIIKPKIKMEADGVVVAEALGNFRASAAILDAHLQDKACVVGDSWTVADFALAAALPYAQDAQIPLAEFPQIARWYARLNDLPAWREPFAAEA